MWTLPSPLILSFHGRFVILFCCIVLFFSGCTDATGNGSPSGAVPSGNSASTSPARAKADANGSATEEALRAQLSKVQQIMQGMTLDQKLGQLIIVEYFQSNYQDTELPYMISHQFVGGYLYQTVNHNFAPPTNTISSARAFAAQANNDAKIPLLVAIDQEGGLVNKIGENFYGPSPSAANMVAQGDPNYALTQGVQTSKWMQSVGINTDLAPVVDVQTVDPAPPVYPLLRSRTFGNDPKTVATYAGKFLDGLQHNSIAGCLKHFPGLGSLTSNDDPHDGLPVVNRSMTDLENVDFAPYRTMIQQNHPAMIMSTDVVTTAIDPDLPAELSPKAINGVLRKELRYNGVVITDGLYMNGIRAKWSIAQASLLSILAGNDLVEGPYTAEQVAGVVTTFKQAINQGQLSIARVDESVQRILLMKMQYGIIHTSK